MIPREKKREIYSIFKVFDDNQELLYYIFIIQSEVLPREIRYVIPKLKVPAYFNHLYFLRRLLGMTEASCPTANTST